MSEEVTYLNCAYMSPILKSVEQAGIEGILAKRNPFTITPHDFFAETERLRESFAHLINAKDPNRVVIIPSVSYGIATAAKNLNLTKGQKIIVLAEQFPSNYYSWKRLCDEAGATLQVVSATDIQNRGESWNKAIIEAIDNQTAAVAMAHVHWADGTLYDLVAIRQATRLVGAKLIIDGTQSVGALPFDVQQIQPDALICAGYKWLLGPYSIGLAYFGPEFDNGVPLEENWINRFESEDFAGLVNYNNHYQPGALRYEVGEHSNFILLPMLAEAIHQINEWQPLRIQQYCEALFADALPVLQKHGYTIEDPRFRSHHLFGIRLQKAEQMEKIKAALATNKISVSIRGTAIRVAPHVYNDVNEVDKLVTVLTQSI